MRLPYQKHRKASKTSGVPTQVVADAVLLVEVLPEGDALLEEDVLLLSLEVELLPPDESDDDVLDDDDEPEPRLSVL